MTTFVWCAIKPNQTNLLLAFYIVIICSDNINRLAFKEITNVIEEVNLYKQSNGAICGFLLQTCACCCEGGDFR